MRRYAVAFYSRLLCSPHSRQVRLASRKLPSRSQELFSPVACVELSPRRLFPCARVAYIILLHPPVCGGTHKIHGGDSERCCIRKNAFSPRRIKLYRSSRFASLSLHSPCPREILQCDKLRRVVTPPGFAFSRRPHAASIRRKTLFYPR